MPGQSSPSFKASLRSYAWLIAILGLLLVVGSGIAYLLNRAWGLQAELGLGLGSLFLLGAVLLRPDAVRKAFSRRPVKYASNAVIMSLAFLGILGFINFLSLKNEYEYDLTETGLFTLSEQTVQILENLDEPIQVIGFFHTGDPRLERAEEYLERYSHYTNQLTYEFHDPNIEPALAQSFELTDYGLVFVSDNNYHQVRGIDEQGITSGLIRVTNETPRTVYFITGHGEHRIDDGGKEGYSTLKESLERENFSVRELNLSARADIPSEATALILAGADRELLETERQLIEDWMAQGGNLMLLVDPLEPVPLEKLLQAYGLSLGPNFVVEDFNHSLVTLGPKGLEPQVIAPMIIEYPYHEITHNLNGFQSFFPFARSVSIDPTQAVTKQVSPILSTSPGSWAETDFQSSEYVYDETEDLPGPLQIGVAAEDAESGARLVIFGNAGFVTNQNLSSQVANLDLFSNALNWLTEEEALISIRPKQPENRRLFLTPMQASLTLLTAVILIPGLVFLTGVGIWWQRR